MATRKKIKPNGKEPQEGTVSRLILLNNRRRPLANETGKIMLYETLAGARKARGKRGRGFIAEAQVTYRWGGEEVQG